MLCRWQRRPPPFATAGQNFVPLAGSRLPDPLGHARRSHLEWPRGTAAMSATSAASATSLEFAGKQNLNRRGRFGSRVAGQGCQDNLSGVLEIATGQGCLTIELFPARATPTSDARADCGLDQFAPI
jgi:hypothetical protein